MGDDLRVGQGKERLEGLQNGDAAVELLSGRARSAEGRFTVHLEPVTGSPVGSIDHLCPAPR